MRLNEDPFFRPPPWFQPLDLNRMVRVYRRHLPHWRQEGGVYFVTFRLADALPPDVIRELHCLREEIQRRRAAANDGTEEQGRWQELTTRLLLRSEDALDQCHGACPFRDPAIRADLCDALRFHHPEQCRMLCFTVMPNHVHAVMQPLPDLELERVLKSIKGHSSRLLNQRLRRTGTNWGEESYDTLIRDAEHLLRVLRYVVANGAKAGLREQDYEVWICPQWEAAGWTRERIEESR